MVSSLTLYVFVGGFVQLVAGEAFMSVRFLTFRNPRGRGSNRHCCDGRFFFCVSPCDHHFTLCLDQIDGPPRNVNHCTYGKASSGEIANRNYINFEQKIGRLPNPYIWRLSSWPGQVRLKINIVDIDDHNDNDHVDFLYKVIATEPTKSIVGYRYKLRNNVELSLEVRVYCGKDFYGLNCSVYCHARDDDFLGHYTCDRQSGSKICMKGWIGDHCVFNEDNCKGVTCHNGGQCLDLHNDFSCKCPKGFLGRFCEVDTDECLDPSLCLHGDCVNNPGSFTCDCHKGYTGAMCDENIDDCKSLPCLNGGICNDLIGNYSCKCVVGFTGLVCETDVDECDFEPCANNATCVNTVGAYKCDCLPGYRGNDCSLDVNECLRRPCLNGGTCNNYRGAYECECLEGFEGTICESDIDECQVTDSLCQNNGTCHNSHGGYSCECNQGYQGQLCENDVDECERYPCEHGGQCQNLPGTFSCECQNGYTGELCETNIDECESNICQHGGNCTDLDGSFLCQCTPFWEGATCSDNVDECLSYPCQNNGQCQNAEEGFNCVCLRGFLGNLCQEDLDECEMDGYCVNNSTCVNSLGGYTCECQDGWRGQHCEEDINECEKYGCHNLGTCVNVEGSFLCLCPINWMGQRCEIDVDECQEEYNPCRNNGTCTNLIGTYQCYCTQGWTGILCDTDINECEEDLQLCSIRGNSSIDKYNSTDTDQHMVCLNTQPGYACLCAPGWTGELCDVDIDECSVGTTESNLDDLHQSTPVNTEDDGVSSTVENQHDTGDSVSSLNQSAPNITDEISLPIYVACQINESNKWAVNKGLKKMFIDSGLFDGKKLKVDHKSEVGTSEKGDIITSIYPIISEDQRPLTDQEIIHVISRFTYKFRDYIFCPLFLDSVGGRYSFSSQPLNSETANWYPGLITACVLLVVVGLVLALVKCRRGKLCCASNYNLETEDERNRSFRNEVYTDSIFAIAQSDDHYTPSDIQQPNRMDDTSSLVEPNSRVGPNWFLD